MAVNFEEKRAAKRERFEDLAARHRQTAAALDKTNRDIGAVMNGQPILIGHHSEKRHRRELEKMWKREDKKEKTRLKKLYGPEICGKLVKKSKWDFDGKDRFCTRDPGHRGPHR